MRTLSYDAEAQISLGATQAGLGQLDNAVTSFRRALEIDPGYPRAHNCLGNALAGLGQLNDAVASFRRALALNPNYAEAHSNLGVVYADIGQLEEAATSFRRALEIKPDCATALNNLGNILTDLKQFSDAEASFRQALAIRPDYAEAHSNLGNTLRDLGQHDEAVASYRQALAVRPDYTVALSNLLFTHSYTSDQSPTELLAEARRFGDIVAKQAHPHAYWSNTPEPGRCLRIGLVSGDLRHHPVGYFLEGVLAALKSNASGLLEIIAYPSYSEADAMTERIKNCCQGWHSAVGLSDEALANRIRDDGIDILIDLAGHTAHNRLPVFAWKPAPVQVSWLGYCATTGLAEIDYYLADAIALPSSLESQFVESVWRLPESYLCLSRPNVDLPVAVAPALTEGRVTFGSFNNLSKMTDETVRLWARILHAVPRSRLFLKSRHLCDESVLQTTLARYASHGIGADRLLLAGHLNERGSHLAAYNRVDIALDPFPYNGVTTTAEALWMGVPVLSLAGDRFLARQGVTLLTNANLPDWIASDFDDYVARAIRHASDVQNLASLRSVLRQQVLASPIFDAARFAQHFEAALREMWQIWCSSRKHPVFQTKHSQTLNATR